MARSAPEPSKLDVATTSPAAASAPADAAVTSAPATGYVSVSAPSDVQLFENGVLLGSSRGGRLALAPGAHQIEMVNETLGYRHSPAGEGKSNETASITLEFPSGTIALNATPWAEVLIDGRSVGETPIGNLPVSVGT